MFLADPDGPDAFLGKVTLKTMRLAAFSSEVSRRSAMGIVAALDFDDVARNAIEESALRTISRAELVRMVDFWDPLKQRAACTAFA